METFKIEVKETLSRTNEIEANSMEEALQKIEDLYQEQSIVLDAHDFVQVEFLKIQD
jgi:hypothetical protein